MLRFYYIGPRGKARVKLALQMQNLQVSSCFFKDREPVLLRRPDVNSTLKLLALLRILNKTSGGCIY